MSLQPAHHCTPPGRRRPRASFERTLERIMVRIESREVHDIHWKGDYFENYKPCSARVRVRALWVVGSFARGAAECGDLDLVMDVEAEGREPRRTTLASQVAGRHPDTVVYIGTPEKNSAHVAFPDAVLLWSQENRDWQGVLKGIVVQKEAGRFARSYDVLPLRREQFSCGVEPDELVQLHDKRILKWEWLPLEDISDEIDGPEAQRFLRRIAYSRGSESLRSLTYAVAWFSQGSSPLTWDNLGTSQAAIRMGDAIIITGRSPSFNIRELDSSISYARIAIVPHVSRRGPNGIWVISRGPEHPLEKQFATLECNALAGEDGQPLILSMDRFIDDGKAVLFGGEDARYKKVRMCKISGTELLSLLASVGWITINGKEFWLRIGWQDPQVEPSVVAAIQALQGTHKRVR